MPDTAKPRRTGPDHCVPSHEKFYPCLSRPRQTEPCIAEPIRAVHGHT